MSLYRVSYYIDYEIEVEAESKEDAIDKAGQQSLRSWTEEFSPCIAELIEETT